MTSAAYNDYLKSLSKDTALQNGLAALLEAEKEKNFQSVFKSLWPNLHEKLNNPPDDEYSKKVAELEKKKELFNAIIQKDIDIYKSLAPKKPEPVKPTPFVLPPNPLPSTTQDTISITIGGLNTGNPKIDINNMRPTTTPTPSAIQSSLYAPNWSFLSQKINTMSGYDFPNINCTQIHNSTEDNLIKSIQESQEKLRLASKLEKTTDIVDDIVCKVKVLQSEMKKKSTALEIQSEIEKLRKSREGLYDFLDNKDCHMHLHRHNHDLSSSHRSRSIEKLHHHHDLHHHHLLHDSSDHHHRHQYHRSSSAHRLSRNSSPVSILKSTEIITHPIRKRSVSFHRSSSSDLERIHHRQKSIERVKTSYKHVAPKVNSWNFSKSKLDDNIY